MIQITPMITKDKIVFTEWIIESPELFAGYLQELYGQCARCEGKFVLSQGIKELDISKYVEIITDPFAVELNGRKIINKLYAELNELSKDEMMYTKTLQLTQHIQEYLLDLESNTNHILQFNNEMDVKTEDSTEKFFERLVCYIKNAIEVLSVKVFVFINLRSYLTDNQMQELIQEITYQEVHALFIENQERTCLKGGIRYIIDKDGCEIY